MADEPLEDEPERLTEPADDDIMDVSIESPPTVFTTYQIKWGLIKDSIAAGAVAISDDIIPIGNAAGNGIEDSTMKGGGIASDEDALYIAQKDFFNGTDYGFWQGDGGNTQVNSGTGGLAIISIANSIKFVAKDGAGSGVSFAAGDVGDIASVGAGTLDAGSGARLHVRGLDTTSATDGFTVSNRDNDDTHSFQVRDDGLVFLLNGTGINEFSTDGTLLGDSDDVVPTEKAVKTYVDAQSGGGWLGSETRIKIAPWDIVSYNDKDGVSIQDDGGVVNDAAAKITTMVTGVFIPTGYKATAFMINASANIAIELFESQIDDSTAVSRGSGNANTEINITNVDSTITNYLSIIIVEAGNDIYGGYITIEKI